MLASRVRVTMPSGARTVSEAPLRMGGAGVCLFLIGVADVLGNMLGTVVMLLATAPDHLLELVVVLIRMTGRGLK